MAGTTEQTRMYCVDRAITAIGAGAKVYPEDIVNYAAILEDYLRFGKKKSGLVSVDDVNGSVQ